MRLDASEWKGLRIIMPKNKSLLNNKLTVSSIASLSLATAAAFLFSYLEALFPFPLPFPGIKLGLANLVIVLLLYEKSVFQCVITCFLKNILMALTFGNLFLFAYSMTGGLLSIVFMYVIKKKFDFHVISVSVAGGIAHNLGQFFVAALMFGFSALLGYFPVLYFSGMITGGLIGIISYECRKRLPVKSQVWN
jgi:heptaprenyl diphosphate synthase